MFNVNLEDTQAVTLDNATQVYVTERIIEGMSGEYVPTWDLAHTFPTDSDTYGHDYVSVTDGMLALLNV